jgi:proline iminopeptidase
VDVRGTASDLPLLFLHGGPGQGAYEFMAMQGERLGRQVRLIGLDQRGVGRSAPLPPGASLTMADLIADCEEVRRALGIERWTVLGQSFGGGLALRYVTCYPGAVAAAVFENPVWDPGLSSRAALPRVAAMLAERGHQHAAGAALAAMERERSPQQLLAAYRSALDSLDGDRESFFVPSEQTRARLREARTARLREHPDGETFDDDSSERHHQAISADPATYDCLLPLLARLAAPALLVTGGLDPLTSAEQRDAFQRASRHNQMREFRQAGHFVHADEPDAYASIVAEFLRAHWPPQHSALQDPAA